MTTLQVRDLALRAGHRVLLDHLTLDIAPGQRWALLGPNGCGKTTLLRTLAGAVTPAAGRILLDGRPIDTIPTRELARLRAWCPQQQEDVFALSALDIVLAARQPYAGRMGWLSPEDERIALACLARLDVQHLAQEDARHLSGGERQRVALAAALAQDTPLLLLDEPTAHLDVPHQLAVARLLATLDDKGVVLSLHDVNLALRCCTHALLYLPGGHVAGPLDEVLTPPLISQAWRCEMRELWLDGLRHFLPVDTAAVR
jgi:iron complex transport system ATP-binding protein